MIRQPCRSLARSLYTATSSSSSVAPAADAKTTLYLMGLPTTAIPADIRRMAHRNGIRGAYEVHLEYKQYRPVGRASIIFNDQESAKSALDNLEKATLSGQQITSFIRDSEGPSSEPKQWFRGWGPDAGLKERGKSVVLQGIPMNMSVKAFTNALLNERFQLREDEDGKVVEKVSIDTDADKPTSRGRWLVHLSSVSEANRLVRMYHMTVMDEEEQTAVQAHIVY